MAATTLPARNVPMNSVMDARQIIRLSSETTIAATSAVASTTLPASLIASSLPR